MAKESSQKFIARNRAPRVQIEYDVELYGSEKKVQLPFVMGVLADLSGKPAEPLPPVADRKFLDIDVDNFDSRMKAIKPRVAFQVPNTLTGEGNVNVEELAVPNIRKRLRRFTRKVGHHSHDERKLHLFLRTVQLDIIFDLHTWCAVTPNEFLTARFGHNGPYLIGAVKQTRSAIVSLVVWNLIYS